MAKHLFFGFVFIFITSTASFSQAIIWQAGLNGFFDNREYFNDFAEPQSILGVRSFVEGGFAVDENNSFSVGIDYMYEFGSQPTGENISPTMYYHHLNKEVEIFMGAFGRHGKIDMPNVLQSDTFNYYRPNVEGIFLRFTKPFGEQIAWLDWTSRQTLTERETFLIGVSGKLHTGIFYAQYDFLMYHFAGTAIQSSEGVRDNGGLVSRVGVNLTKFTPLDSLSLSTGFAGSYDRVRDLYDLQYTKASYSELYANYKAFGVRSVLYVGDGHNSMVGDKMYTAPQYNRTDLIFHAVKKGRVSADVELALHFVPGAMDFSQRFLIIIDISGKKNIKTFTE